MQCPICKRLIAVGATCLHIGLAIVAADGDMFQPPNWTQPPQQITATGRIITASAAIAVEARASA